jgi:hypothetical protein
MTFCFTSATELSKASKMKREITGYEMKRGQKRRGYSIIRLPCQLCELVGLKADIYQTTQYGKLASLVTVNKKIKTFAQPLNRLT